MKRSRMFTTLAVMLAMLMTAGFGSLAHAELRVVDGNLWSASSMAEKRAYLIGVANAVAVNRALEAKRGQVDPQSANNRIEAALDADTIDRAIARIDAWYSANPSQKGAPVLGVVWMSMVKGK